MMNALSKIFLLLIILSSLFAISSPSLSFAATDYKCSSATDCQQFSSLGFTWCYCMYGESADHKSCNPNPSDTNAQKGSCSTPRTSCTATEGCGVGFECSSTTNMCITREEAEAGITPEFNTPWYIVTPVTVSNYLQSGDKSQNALSTQLNITTTIASIAINALGGSDFSTTGNVKGVHTSGATGILTGLVLNLTTTPVISSKEYFADLGHNLGISPVTPAYAQGIGFGGLSPLLSLWKLTRDIAYLAFVVIFIVVGLMVMLRKKIDPRTVATIQDSLPKIIVSLLLVTFSYAIAGLVVDLSTFATRLIATTLADKGYIAQTGATKDSTKLDNLLQMDTFRLVNPLRDPGRLAENVSKVTIGPEGSSWMPGWLATITAFLVFWIAGFFIMFKIFFSLLGPYVSIVLSVIFAPIQIMLGAIPGSSSSATSWLKNLIANLAVFPAVFAMMAIAAVLKGYTRNSILGGSADWGVIDQGSIYSLLWSPPVIGNWGVAATDLVSFGILFAIPKVADMIKGAFEIKGQPWEAAPMEEIKGAVGKVPGLGAFVKV